MKSVIILTSHSPRHVYFAQQISLSFNIIGIISEYKENYVADQNNLSPALAGHFKRLTFYENYFFGKNKNFPDAELLRIKKNSINSIKVLDWARSKNPDAVMLFGTGILSNDWLDLYKDRIVNLHLGHSPRYRGSATLLWPFINNELESVAATIHIAEKQVDSGGILKIIESDPILENENYYQITNKLIKKSIDCYPAVVNDFLEKKIKPVLQDPRQNKYLYKRADFTEAILNCLMEKYG